MSSDKTATHVGFEPLAIVGIGCRFPGGVESPDSYWEMLVSGTDAIKDVPMDRWNPNKFFDADEAKPGKSKVKQGGYIDQKLDMFDPLFFGISPREAEFVDPQQRLLLEVTWEAFEDAGIPESVFRGSNTGVYVGAFNLDNLLHHLGKDNLDLIASSTAAGVTMTMLSNRLSYVFDLHGPSVTMDTACSSSMVATHYACQSIWSGESEMAVAAGVNVIMRPEYMVSMSKGGFLSKHGRCKTFDSDAGGYVRGEGAGTIVIKPLKAAVENGDKIYSVIRGTGVNQDGYTQNGISFPSSEAQQELITKVYQKAGIDPVKVNYIEAHGTGTQAGDPIEISSLENVFTPGREASNPCYVGSVKTNFGHTESAAGIASLIKASLVLKNGQVPMNLHFNNPNPNIDFANGLLKVPTELSSLPNSPGEKTLASVNSFGYGGTNSHVILEQAPLALNKTISGNMTSKSRLFPISARTESGLQALCVSYAGYLDNNPTVSVDDLLYTLTERKSDLAYRLVIPAVGAAELSEKLREFSRGVLADDCFTGKTSVKDRERVAFVFTGMGPQWWAMGQELYRSNSTFKNFLTKCDAIFSELSGWSIVDEMMKPEDESKMTSTKIAQPANFLLQAGLVEVYSDWGIKPNAVVGHSVGEVASAYISGALSLHDAICVSYHRSRLQETLAGSGSMLAVGLGEDEVSAVVELYSGVSIAAINGKSSVTLAGDAEQIQEIAKLLEDQMIFNRILRVEVAYHSSMMDPIQQDLKLALAKITPQNESVHLYSTATGKKLSGENMDANYWWENVRKPVHFRQAINSMVSDGYETFLEIGPHPVTKNFINECVEELGGEGIVISSLVRKKDEVSELFKSIGNLFCSGNFVKFISPDKSVSFIDLPKQQYEKSSFWSESEQSIQFRLGELDIPYDDRNHVLLLNPCSSPGTSFETELNAGYFPYLNDHKISGMVVFPGAGYVEAGLALAHELYGEDGVSIENLKLKRMLVVDNSSNQKLNVQFNESTNKFTVFSSDNSGKAWIDHADGTLLSGNSKRIPTDTGIPKDLGDWTELDVDKLYQSFDEMGLGYTNVFRGIEKIYTKGKRVISKIDSHSDDLYGPKYHLYPSVLDSAFQSFIALIASESNNPYVPVSIGEVNHFGPIGSEVWSEGEITRSVSGELECNIKLTDGKGNCFVTICGLVCHEVKSTSDDDSLTGVDNCFYEMEWTNIDDEILNTEVNEVKKRTLVLSGSDTSRYSKSIVDLLTERGANFESISLVDNEEIGIQDVATEEDLMNLVRSLEGRLNQCEQIVYVLDDSLRSDSLHHTTTETIITNAAPILAIARHFSGNNSNSDCNTEQIPFVILSQSSSPIGDDKSRDCGRHAVASLGHLLGNEMAQLRPFHIDVSDEHNPEQLKRVLSLCLSGDLLKEDVRIGADGVYLKRLVSAQIPEVNSTEEITVFLNDSGIKVVATNAFTSGESAGFAIESVVDQAEKVIHVESSLFGFDEIHQSAGVSIPTIGTVVDSVVGCEKRVLAFIDSRIPASIVNAENAIRLDLQNFSSPDDLTFLMFSSWLEASTIYSKLDLARGSKILLMNSLSISMLMLTKMLEQGGVEIVHCVSAQPYVAKLELLGVEKIILLDDYSVVDRLSIEYGIDLVDAIVVNKVDAYSVRASQVLKHNGTIFNLDTSSDLRFSRFSGTHINYRPFDVLNDDKLDFSALMNTYLNSAEQYQDIARLISRKRFSEVFDVDLGSRWVGVCLDYKNDEIKSTSVNRLPTVSKKSTYVISGGTSGLGLKVAEFLVSNGVKSVALLSRSGGKPEDLDVLRSHAALSSARVSVIKCDISDAASVRDAIGSIQNTMLPIKGLIHCAMVLDDNLAENTTLESLRKVLAPKVSGALNLHNATEALDIEEFISISSISSLIGNVGQTSYVLANAYLDSFSYWRTSKGLPAKTINLGVLSDVGVVARDGNLADILESKGIIGMNNTRVLNGLSRIIESKDSIQVGLFDVDWKTWKIDAGKSGSSSRFIDLVSQAESEASMAPGLRDLIESLSDEKTMSDAISEMLKSEFSSLLRLSEDDVQSDVSINDYGIDSIMTVEFSRVMRTKYGLEVSTMELLSGPTIASLTGVMAGRLGELA